ncbi:MAG: hypothetical protein PHQ14_08460 [Chromatiales bacterium]|jgi:hypothetical protein|nr:hypothetical protein [Chromatiales bacterium]MDX9767757.1 hypothetical protein [Ectothiorhodospiraceae bacterium]
MQKTTLRALIDAGAVRRLRIVANGCQFHVEVDTPTGSHIASTQRGTPKTWRSLDAVARWVRDMGIGQAQINLERWQPDQRSMI